jgi:3'(2'), 5'-bisphosphate nucleotidase
MGCCDWVRLMSGFERAAAIGKVIQDCGLLAKQMAAQGFEVSQKGPGDFVTDVDRALDQQLAREFANLFPQDFIITEENPASQRLFQQHPMGRFWCIDPIDGTHDFIHTQRDYAVMVGLLAGGEAQVGWIFDPAADQMFFGGWGWGIFRQQGMQVQDCFPQPPVQANRVIIGLNDRKTYATLLNQAIPEMELWQRPGSFGLKIMSVILGQAGLLIYFNRRVKLWDTVAPIALARQAGLTCCDLNGQPVSYGTAAINLETLAHEQPIVIGWKHCIDVFLPRLAAVMQSSVEH